VLTKPTGLVGIFLLGNIYKILIIKYNKDGCKSRHLNYILRTFNSIFVLNSRDILRDSHLNLCTYLTAFIYCEMK